MVANSKESYELRYFQINNEEDDDDDDNEWKACYTWEIPKQNYSGVIQVAALYIAVLRNKEKLMGVSESRFVQVGHLKWERSENVVNCVFVTVLGSGVVQTYRVIGSSGFVPLPSPNQIASDGDVASGNNVWCHLHSQVNGISKTALLSSPA